jgi:hypothetical protein
VDPKKIEAMKDYPHPKTLKILCGFLVLMRYYYKFVQNYGKIVAPLIGLLKKTSFSWNPIVDQYFQALKEDMCMNHVMELPDFTKTFVLKYDA